MKQALLAGAKGYITRDELSETMIDAIRHIGDGGIYPSKRLLRQFSMRQRMEIFAEDRKKQSI